MGLSEMRSDSDPGLETLPKLPSLLFLALTLHSLCLVCGLILVGAALVPDHVTVIAIAMLILHFFLGETLLQGLSARRGRLLLPWFVVTALEECVLALLLVSTLLELSVVPNLAVNKGVLVLIVVLTAARLAMWCKMFLASIKFSHYDQL